MKAESAADKIEWIKKISQVIQAKGGQIRISSDGAPTMRHSLSDGSLVSCCGLKAFITRVAFVYGAFIRLVIKSQFFEIRLCLI